MTLHIADAKLVAKIERLARETSLSEVALVEQAIDRFADGVTKDQHWKRMEEALAKLDAIPDRTDAHDPLEWDDVGLPK